MSKIAELFGQPTSCPSEDWVAVVGGQQCPFLNRKCLKTRKSEPQVSIGTCTLSYGSDARNIVICPFRFLERNQIFTDCIHLLTLHEPGNELRIFPELSLPGGNVDYCLASVRDQKVLDFVGIELQTLDTTGTVWPERQRFLQERGIRVKRKDAASRKGFGMNWKMTAKTTLVQLHHKIETFEHVSKRLVLVLQDHLIEYMRKAFSFAHLRSARLGDPMHFHSYKLQPEPSAYRLELHQRWSTDSKGIAQCLGLQVSANIELDVIIRQLEAKLPQSALLSVGQPIPPSLREEVSGKR